MSVQCYYASDTQSESFTKENCLKNCEQSNNNVQMIEKCLKSLGQFSNYRKEFVARKILPKNLFIRC